MSGSLGDLGTLLPLLIALTLTESISLSTTLVFTGLANILTGLFFGIPLPVQPMKAIAAVAVARSFSIKETSGAGLFVAGVIGLASVTGLLKWAGRIVPIPIVKGIQVGAGLSLVLSAGSTLLQPLGWTSPSAGDNLIWALLAFLLLLATVSTSKSAKGLSRIPYALLMFALGLIIALFALLRTGADNLTPSFISIWRPHTYLPSPADFRTGALTAGLGQVPLTTLNSIIAVTHLSADLLPAQPIPSETSIGMSVAAMNLVGCWFGAMPVCHGSGGLAAQHRFGARSGASIIFLGTIKLVLGLFVGEEWLVGVLSRFPHALLGVMVIAAGVELARVGESLNVDARDLWEGTQADSDVVVDKKPRQLSEAERRERWLVMITTVAGLLAFKNDAVGFVAGLLCHWSLRMPGWLHRSRRFSGTAWAAPLAQRYRDDEEPGLPASS